MSSDDGVYILRTISKWKKQQGGLLLATQPYYVYRVARVFAVENFNWIEKKELYNLGYYMYSVWGESPVYETEEQALKAASVLHDQIGWTEYGIGKIYTSYQFPVRP